eukprot:GHVR01150596.1.p2 GENE.GHVR01150596.1~~GHVR01150596.1.p2  ORF type:complete len:184 (-),score=24.36 GHVR01150596.1:726-1277(-)
MDDLQAVISRTDVEWNQQVHMQPYTRALLHTLSTDMHQNFEEFELHPPQTPQFILDSSATHWGGYYSPGAGRPYLICKGEHKSSCAVAANVKEMEAVVRGLTKIIDIHPEGEPLRILSDNIHVVQSFRETVPKVNWKAPFTRRWERVRKIMEETGWKLNFVHIKGAANVADSLTRPDMTREEV